MKGEVELRCRHTGFFVDLDGGLVAADSDNFTNEVVVADFDLDQIVSVCFVITTMMKGILPIRTWQHQSCLPRQ